MPAVNRKNVNRNKDDRKKDTREKGPSPGALAVADRLHSAAIHLLRQVRQQDAVSGVGPAQLSALSVLVFAGPKTLGELAAAEQVKPPTMSRIVAGLKRSQLIAIARDPADSRRMRISATPRGTSLLQAARRRRIDSLAALLDRLLPEQRALLERAALTLEEALRLKR